MEQKRGEGKKSFSKGGGQALSMGGCLKTVGDGGGVLDPLTDYDIYVYIYIYVSMYKYIFILYIYIYSAILKSKNQIMHHNLCFNLFMLDNNIS